MDMLRTTTSDVEMEELDPDPSDKTGASARSLFMRVDGIYADNQETGLGGKPICMMSGMLFELVDDDWQEEDGEEGEAALGAPRPNSGKSTHANAVEENAVKGAEATVPRSASVVRSSNGTTTPPLRPPPASAPASTKPSGPLFAPNPSLLTSPSTADESSTDMAVGRLSMNDLSSSWDEELTYPDKAKGKGKAVGVPATPPSTYKAKLGPIPEPFPTAEPLPGPSPPYVHALPAAPSKYKFRPILPPSHEALVSLLLLSGRYYPRILSNPLMNPFVANALKNPLAKENEPLWALEGHVEGVHNAVDASIWMASRSNMVKTAGEKAKEELMAYWRSREDMHSESEKIEID